MTGLSGSIVQLPGTAWRHDWPGDVTGLDCAGSIKQAKTATETEREGISVWWLAASQQAEAKAEAEKWEPNATHSFCGFIPRMQIAP